MTKGAFILTSLSFFITAGQGQTPRLVRAVGEGVITVKPDLARVSVGVVTQANTARDAAAENGSRVEGVLVELRRVLGSTADIKTTSYSLAPNYRYNQNAPPTLLGYTASNTLEVAIGDLSLVGTVIDAASQSGANNVGGLQFTLQDQEPVRLQVLGLATKQAKAHAEAIAGGLGGRIGSIFAASEGVSYSPPIRGADTTGPSAPATPIETGLLQIRATVTVEAELQQ